MKKPITPDDIHNLDITLLFQALIGTIGVEKLVNVFEYYYNLKDAAEKVELDFIKPKDKEKIWVKIPKGRE